MQAALSIIIPAFDEAATLETALRRLWDVSLPVPYEVVLVDDGSTDGSAEIAEALCGESPAPMKVLRHEVNRGKTAALRTGIAEARNPLTLIYDADLEYDPQDIPALLAPVLDGRADAVYGSRFLSPQRRVLFFWHALGNRLVTALANLFANLNLTDMETCFKLVRTDVLKEMRLRSERFGFEPEVTVKLGRLGQRVYEVPIRYAGRSYDEGKKIRWWDAVRAVGTILRAGLFEAPLADRQAALRYAMRGLGGYYGSLLKRTSRAIGDRVLATCAGAGGLAGHLVQRRQLTLVERDPASASWLRTRFSHRPNVQVVEGPPFDEPFAAQEGFDTVLCFSELDTLEDDASALRHLVGLLRPDGAAVLLLPAHPFFHGTLDRSLGRKRRYRREEVRQLMKETGLEVVSLRQVNAPGAVAWFVAGRILRLKRLGSGQVRLFRLVLPLVRLERYLPPPFGLSWLVVARKNAGLSSIG